MKEYLEQRISELRKYLNNSNLTEMKTIKAGTGTFIFPDPFYTKITSGIEELMKALNHLNKIENEKS